MDLLFKHNQEKIDRKSGSKSCCDLKVFYDGLNINYVGIFDFDYQRYGVKRHVIFEHALTVDTLTGNINVIYRLINDEVTGDSLFRSMIKNRKNDFSLFADLTQTGLLRGEKRFKFWGVRYERATEKIVNIIQDILKPKFKNEFYSQKDYITKYEVNPLYDLIVDFHLDSKKIKGHDGIYQDIQGLYPNKKWLTKNDNKFLPAILDSYGIKSKYLIGELNKRYDKTIQIDTLNYMCKLFGENYLDYLKQIKWEDHCYDKTPNRKIHALRNESEKRSMVQTINKWEKNTLKSDSLIYSVNRLLSIREKLTDTKIDLKFNCKNDSEFDNLMELWLGMKLYYSRGYRLMYGLPEEFINEIEEDIIIDGELFKPKMILTDESFRVEGFNMKNCMSKQFSHGVIYLYVALQNNKTRINLQYRKGLLIQSYGKANTPVIPFFAKAVEVLNERFKKHPHISWKKEKYDILKD